MKLNYLFSYRKLKSVKTFMKLQPCFILKLFLNLRELKFLYNSMCCSYIGGNSNRILSIVCYYPIIIIKNVRLTAVNCYAFSGNFPVYKSPDSLFAINEFGFGLHIVIATNHFPLHFVIVATYMHPLTTKTMSVLLWDA